ncbi:MAG: GspH/FimT family pseudopilin [Planctomycetaceae bacterium]
MISFSRSTIIEETRNRGGFTAVEAVLAVIIMGIMAAIAIPKFAAVQDRYRVDAAAQRIKYDLSLARQHAISTSTSRSVQFTPASGTYTIAGLSDLNHPSQSYSADLTASPYSVVLVSASLGGDTTLTYNLYGQPDSGGTVTVRSGSIQQTVTINSDTGQAAVP